LLATLVDAEIVTFPKSLSTAVTLGDAATTEPPPSAVEKFKTCPTSKLVTSSNWSKVITVPVNQQSYQFFQNQNHKEQ
jgi:hypothetical protein